MMSLWVVDGVYEYSWVDESRTSAWVMQSHKVDKQQVDLTSLWRDQIFIFFLLLLWWTGSERVGILSDEWKTAIFQMNVSVLIKRGKQWAQTCQDLCCNNLWFGPSFLII